MPRHIVCLTFDFDTQSGFIARGMTTPTPLSRGEFGGRVACGPHPEIPQGARHQGDLVHAGLHHRELAAGERRGGRGRPRDRPPLLGAYPERQPDPRRGGGRPRPRQREHPEAHRPHRARLPLAVLGPEPAHHRSADQARLPLRLEPDGRRLHSLSRAARRQGRARQALRLRRGDRADRNADLLVARRPSAFRVHPHAADGGARACSPRAT